MRLNGMTVGRRARGFSLAAALLAVGLSSSGQSQADGEVPSEIAALLPSAATLDGGSWAVFDTEFGKTFGANMRAEFPGFPSSCDFTVGPELHVEIKGDTAWEEPPMLDMAVQIYEESIGQGRTSLPDRVASLQQSNNDVQSVGALQEEDLPGGHIVAMEYTENCAKRPNGTNTVLQGFARKGATTLTFQLWISAGMAEARAMGAAMIEGFQKLDFNPLIEGG
jgi:hypothetical protein